MYCRLSGKQRNHCNRFMSWYNRTSYPKWYYTSSPNFYIWYIRSLRISVNKISTKFNAFMNWWFLNVNRLRDTNDIQANRAAVMVDILRKSAPPAYSTRLRAKRKHIRKTTTMYQLHIPSLTYVRFYLLTEILF